MRFYVPALALVASVSPSAYAFVEIQTVRVGNVGNVPDSPAHSGNPAGQGRVTYAYDIGKYEVTAGQYTEFLNCVALADEHGLYNPDQERPDYGSGIRRDGDYGSYVYTVDPAHVNRPVNYVSYWDACRFGNWLHNGQPSGLQTAATTEDGAYTLTAQAIANNTVTRNAAWQWSVTSEDEWYKAAYYKGGGPVAGYWL